MKHGFRTRGVATILVLACVPTLALAYIDPGNGAYMVQALMTMVAAGIFYLRHPLRTLKAVGRWLSGSSRTRTAVKENEVPSSEASVGSCDAAGTPHRSEEI